MKYSFTWRQPCEYAAVTVRIRSSLLTILLITRRSRSLPPSGAKVRPDRLPLRENSFARSMLNASTRVDGSDRLMLLVLVPVGELLGHRRDLGVVGAGQRQQADLFEAGGTQALLDHRADRLDAPLAHRTGDHARLAEPAAARATAEDLDRHPLVDGLGERDERRLRVRPLVEVHHGVLLDPRRHAGAVRRDGRDASVRPVRHVVEARDVHAAGRGEAGEQPVASAGTSLGLPVAHDVGDRADDLLAVAEHGGVDEVGDRLRVERGVPAGDDDRVRLVAVGRVQRDAGEVERGEQVRVAEFGGEADAEQVERADRAVRVDGELRDAVLAQQRFEVRPHRVGALGQRVVALVEHLVEDLHALVRQADLVGVRIHQRPPDRDLVPVLRARVQLAADVLDRLAHARQQRLETGEQRFHVCRLYG